MKKIVITLTLIATVLLLIADDQLSNRNSFQEGDHDCNKMEKEQGNDCREGDNHNCDFHQEFRKRGEGMFGREFFENINLTDDQKVKIETLRNEHQKKMIAFEAQVATLEIDKKTAVTNEKFQEARNLTTQIGKIHVDMENEKLTLHEKIMNMLNDEQKAKLKEMRENHSGMDCRDGKQMGKMEKGQHWR